MQPGSHSAGRDFQFGDSERRLEVNGWFRSTRCGQRTAYHWGGESRFPCLHSGVAYGAPHPNARSLTSPNSHKNLFLGSFAPILTVLGIDDWAFAKGRRYGTILVDLERGVPVDLLPDRTAATLAAWLKAHPSIEVITRDRFSDYALAVNEVYPAIPQIADRWHLLKNLRETLERVLRRLHEGLRNLSPSAELLAITDNSRPRRLRPPSANEQAATDASRLRRFQVYRMVHYLLARGLSQRKIASLLNLHRVTVRLYAEANTFPERIPTRPRVSTLDPHLSYLQQRWQAGCTNARQLFREIRPRGYMGSYQHLARWAQAQRQLKSSMKEAAPLPAISTFALPAARHLTWLFLRPQTSFPRMIRSCSSIFVTTQRAGRFMILLNNSKPCCARVLRTSSMNGLKSVLISIL